MVNPTCKQVAVTACYASFLELSEAAVSVLLSCISVLGLIAVVVNDSYSGVLCWQAVVCLNTCNADWLNVKYDIRASVISTTRTVIDPDIPYVAYIPP